MFEAVVEAVVGTYWILTLHWALYQSAIAMKMLCNKHPKYPAQTAILPHVGLQVAWVWLLQARPGSIMGWVSGHLGGSLGRSSSVSPPGTSGEHGMVFSWQWQGTQRCSRTHGVQAQAWACCHFLLTLLTREGPVASVRRPLHSQGREDTRQEPGRCLPTGSMDDLADSSLHRASEWELFPFLFLSKETDFRQGK